MLDIEVYERQDEQWGWRLRAGNGEIVAVDGGQGFRDAHDAARSVQQFLTLMVNALAGYPENGALAHIAEIRLPK